MFDITDGEGNPHFTACRVFTMNASTWLNVNRRRIYCIFLNKEQGGMDALDEIEGVIDDHLCFLMSDCDLPFSFGLAEFVSPPRSSF